MVTKTTKDGRSYDIDGKVLVWHPEQFEGDDPIPDVRLPLRMKLGKLLDLGEAQVASNNETMLKLITTLAPHQEENIREMDVNDFQSMFMTWKDEYALVTGADLGESSASGASSVSTEAQPSTTSENGSTSA